MSAESPPIDLTAFDYDRPLAGVEQIRAANPQRHEFEMLSGIVHLDPAAKLIVGFKDIRPDDFWVPGDMPGYALFPGVLMCEAAAQLSGFFYISLKIGDPGVLMGLGGIDEARFFRPVRPGERLVLVGTGIKIHRRLTRFRVTGYVGTEKAFEAII